MQKTAEEIINKDWSRPKQFSLFEDPLDAQFIEFHHKNPHVYKQLRALAFVWKNAGNDKCAIDLLINKLRWEIGITSSGSQFAISNNFGSRYSRLMEANEPELVNFFTKRMLRSQ